MLSKNKAISEHDKIIQIYGGSLGINYEGILDGAVNKYNENKNKRDAAIDFYYDILIGHPFIDGNKRTATHFLEHLLELNSYKLTATNTDLVTLALSIAQRNEESQKKYNTPIRRKVVSNRIGKYVKKVKK